MLVERTALTSHKGEQGRVYSNWSQNAHRRNGRAPRPSPGLHRLRMELLLKDEVRLSYALRGAKDNPEIESFPGSSKAGRVGHSRG